MRDSIVIIKTFSISNWLVRITFEYLSRFGSTDSWDFPQCFRQPSEWTSLDFADLNKNYWLALNWPSMTNVIGFETEREKRILKGSDFLTEKGASEELDLFLLLILKVWLMEDSKVHTGCMKLKWIF